MAELIFDDGAFDEYCLEISKKAFAKLGDEFQMQLTEERKDYPRTTIRKEGRGKTVIAGTPRDVVDTKGLVDSYEYSYNVGVNSYTGTYTWSAFYLNGARIPHPTCGGDELRPTKEIDQRESICNVLLINN